MVPFIPLIGVPLLFSLITTNIDYLKNDKNGNSEWPLDNPYVFMGSAIVQGLFGCFLLIKLIG